MLITQMPTITIRTMINYYLRWIDMFAGTTFSLPSTLPFIVYPSFPLPCFSPCSAPLCIGSKVRFLPVCDTSSVVCMPSPTNKPLKHWLHRSKTQYLHNRKSPPPLQISKAAAAAADVFYLLRVQYSSNIQLSPSLSLLPASFIPLNTHTGGKVNLLDNTVYMRRCTSRNKERKFILLV